MSLLLEMMKKQVHCLHRSMSIYRSETRYILVSKFHIGVRERPLDSQGGAWVFLKKNILALVLAKKNILALTMCEKNILAPSIEKKMSALYP